MERVCTRLTHRMKFYGTTCLRVFKEYSCPYLSPATKDGIRSLYEYIRHVWTVDLYEEMGPMALCIGCSILKWTKNCTLYFLGEISTKVGQKPSSLHYLATGN